MIHDNFAWLRGYPTGTATAAGLPWLSVPASGSGVAARPMTVDGPLLARAYHARDTLYKKFPQALPAVVGDRDVRYARITADLDVVREVATRPGSLPTLDDVLERLCHKGEERQTIRELAERHQALAAALWRLAWVAPHNGLVAELIAFIAEKSDELTTCANRMSAGCCADLLLLLADLIAADRGASARQVLWCVVHLAAGRDALPHLCLDAAGVKAAANRANFPLEPLRGMLKYLERAYVDSSDELVTLLLELGRRSANDWLHGLDWLDVLAPTELTWRSSDVAGALLRVADEFEATIRSSAARRWVRGQQVKRLRNALMALAQEDPWAYSAVAHVPHLIRAALVTSRSKRTWFQEAQRTLSDLPQSRLGYEARRAFIAHWLSLAEKASPDKLVRIVRWTRSFLATPSLFETRIEQWRSMLENEAYGAATPELRYFSEPATGCRFDDLLRLRQRVSDHAQTWEAAMGWYCGPDSMQEVLVETTFELMRATGDLELSASALDLLVGRDALQVAYWLGRTERLPVASRLAGADVEDLVAVIVAMGTRSDSGAIDNAAKFMVSDAGTRRIALTLARAGRATAFHRIAERVALLGALLGDDETAVRLAKCSEPALSDASWVAPFPQRLQAVLQRLHAVESDAQAIAARYLKASVQSSEELRREIELLRRLAAEASGSRRDRLLQRVANLDERLKRPKAAPSAKDLDKTRQRLERRAFEAETKRFMSRLDNEIRAAEEATLGSGAKIDAIRAREFSILLDAAAQLPKRYKYLAFQMLAASARGETGMYDHADNHAFVDRMRSIGLDLAPWLEGGLRRDDESGDGAKVRMQIERDPARIMLMGAPFGTCLAPHGINFHSAALNAAAANKAVVYAHDRRGAVVGRCLLALTERGEILVYRFYTHGNRVEFASLMTTYVKELAARMGTRVAVAGRVAELVERGWYDDGHVDICGTMDFLKHDSDFMKAVAEIPVGGLRGEIERRLGPDGLRPEAIPTFVYAMPENRQAEIFSAFAEEIMNSDELDAEFQLWAAKVLHRNGNAQASRRIVFRLLRRRHAQRGWWMWRRTDVASELVALGEPSLALRVLHDGSSRRRRDWGVEDRRVAASAYEALRRPAQAKKLMEGLEHSSNIG